jgi:hypothetical protein
MLEIKEPDRDLIDSIVGLNHHSREITSYMFHRLLSLQVKMLSP